ncbi:beta-carotene 15,15'-monooxygenase [Sporosarcina thermotolerans]|uniref:Beta-carotene 15,15'-monooxygenase n=1 Tax=Sporosarcina thermotolerans TaxID=633404 RepID=A0AAW9A5G0_9BACL|nr:beta-carotene 15,15'-monooxygenase [Sporosarcina thermotolerans]MDW0116442.1 beta-carotene 15,15'-monooxygenase [Sporosarcina thermotolerans]WHT48388.1 beta-carotene 15,15'-monooxygenase [Sporosarcina thermotolerans]
MVLNRFRSKQVLFAGLLLFVLVSNYFVYRLPAIPMPENARAVVIGSLVDLAIVAPLLMLSLTRKKGFSLKRFITFMVMGLIAARFIIPINYFEPFKFVPYAAIGVEGLIVLAELGLIFLLIKHLPRIIKEIKEHQVSSLFAFPALVKEKVSSHPLISIVAAESLMFYYAFASWKRKPPVGEIMFSLHQKTSLLAFYIMLIHAIVIETIGIHWWLHGKSAILSIVLLILNIYTVIYFIADIQAVRLNPLKMNENHMQVSLGLGKRMEIPYDAIGKIDWGLDAEHYNLKSKGLIEFMARDFEEVKPHCIIHFSRPLKATLFLGMEKEFTATTLRVDEPERFRHILENKRSLPLPK